MSHQLTAYLSIFFLNLNLVNYGHFVKSMSARLYFRPLFEFCESFLESNSPEANLDDLIDCGNFFVRVYLPLIRKDSSTHMRGPAVYIKEVLPFLHNLSLENSTDSYLYFRLAILHSVSSLFFFLCRSPSLSLCMVFILFHLT